MRKNPKKDPMLTHVNARGKAQMVDVSSKPQSERSASAFAEVKLSKATFQAIKKNSLKKGDALAVAKIAGISAAKKTSDLIPLCHNIFISSLDLNFSLNEKKSSIEILSHAKTNAPTGIEMEALVAVSVAALTIYDMGKAMDKSARISEIHLLSKKGGKSGDYHFTKEKK